MTYVGKIVLAKVPQHGTLFSPPGYDWMPYVAEHQTGLSDATPSAPMDSIVTLVVQGRPRYPQPITITITAKMIEEGVFFQVKG